MTLIKIKVNIGKDTVKSFHASVVRPSYNKKGNISFNNVQPPGHKIGHNWRRARALLATAPPISRGSVPDLWDYQLFHLTSSVCQHTAPIRLTVRRCDYLPRRPSKQSWMGPLCSVKDRDWSLLKCSSSESKTAPCCVSPPSPAVSILWAPDCCRCDTNTKAFCLSHSAAFGRRRLTALRMKMLLLFKLLFVKDLMVKSIVFWWETFLASSEAPSGFVSSVVTVVSHTFSCSAGVCAREWKCLSQSSGLSLFHS